MEKTKKMGILKKCPRLIPLSMKKQVGEKMKSVFGIRTPTDYCLAPVQNCCIMDPEENIFYEYQKTLLTGDNNKAL
jgi:hypothetical protein